MAHCPPHVGSWSSIGPGPSLPERAGQQAPALSPRTWPAPRLRYSPEAQGPTQNHPALQRAERTSCCEITGVRRRQAELAGAWGAGSLQPPACEQPPQSRGSWSGVRKEPQSCWEDGLGSQGHLRALPSPTEPLCLPAPVGTRAAGCLAFNNMPGRGLKLPQTG